jgi:1-aminocyclopropane-1-carboxylate deaminase/D-cysteine desulfhydrase-like pyridoxal-dependent ACC family enzyme
MMILTETQKHPIEVRDEKVHTGWLEQAALELFIRRFDQIHPFTGGNKLFKLNGWLALRAPHQCLVSFGGAWSNHLLALAAAGHQLGIPTAAIIRGEAVKPFNPVLQKLESLGMQLHFVSRTAYRIKQQDHHIAALISNMGDVLVIPEGGAGEPGIMGAMEMVSQTEQYDWVVLPGGTGTTAAGVATRLQGSKTKVLVFQVLKGEAILHKEVQRTSGIDLHQLNHLFISEDFHFGGYARVNEALSVFAAEWAAETGIFLDYVYGLKAMAGLKKTAGCGFFKPGTRLLYLHTGGYSEINS